MAEFSCKVDLLGRLIHIREYGFYQQGCIRDTSLGFCGMIPGAKSLKKGQSFLPTLLTQHRRCPSILLSISHLSIHTHRNTDECILCVQHCAYGGLYVISFNSQFYAFRNYHNSCFTHKETLRKLNHFPNINN